MRVFVLNQRGEPLMPCSPRKARILLKDDEMLEPVGKIEIYFKDISRDEFFKDLKVAGFDVVKKKNL